MVLDFSLIYGIWHMALQTDFKMMLIIIQGHCMIGLRASPTKVQQSSLANQSNRHEMSGTPTMQNIVVTALS